ncbi:GNAT family N-acetyltransferase [Anseongella ginsenosidimutans]|nr:GNAT family N-acetyltransferase [Anseongella ginsenosidimutans]
MERTVIRKAEKKDCAAMLELVRELAVYEKAPDEVTVSLDEMKEAGFGPSPVWWAFVAETDGKLVGISLYYIRYSTWKGRRLYLEDIVVNEAFRGKGLGKLLFDATAREAGRMGMKGMTWQVLDWNQPAINFYKRYQASIEKGWLNASLSEEQLANF